MAELIIEVRNLVRTYGKRRALDNIDLTLEQGTVLGLVGQNGAGKTTLIKHLLGLLRAEQGTVRVFGKDPVSDPPGVLSRIGYLSEEGDLPLWMRVDDLMRYSAAFYPTWDAAYAEKLRREFDLSLDAKLGQISKGQRARAGLLVALAFRPDLLLLDEPSSGLDPVVRRDILSAIIRTIADEGRTVLFSSHLLSEVEQVSDRVAMVREGRLILNDDLARIKETHQRIDVRLREPRQEPPTIPGAVGWNGAGRNWSALWHGDPQELDPAVALAGGEVAGRGGASLDDIFVAHAGKAA
ncbi:ABC transporter ATP-binding protein [Fimbriimonas ginsengisoli]|uniref:ABC transporter ATP binding protein n=1 Tax=Fimbriimonas ginsengisoli Gsoil 348 TaxID=661478 RepID=A0A068NWA2_FIMGI|nr:ABC transporter ATP-binding protein [Fimbriimonas ginsengisoli]AIE85884.1 ABC transporter ATP binding protein [Fimbriimonas ginsengisoli Gsoil 348]